LQIIAALLQILRKGDVSLAADENMCEIRNQFSKVSRLGSLMNVEKDMDNFGENVPRNFIAAEMLEK